MISAIDPQIESRLESLRHLVGSTHLLQIVCRFQGEEYTIYAKYEASNFTGSIKDRMALHILTKAHANGLIAPGAMIAEATSGNTGISFAAIGRALGHPVTIFMPDWMSRERVLLIKNLGAKIVLVSAAEGGFLGSIERARALARDCAGTFLPKQFENELNVDAHYKTTGPELVRQFAKINKIPSAFVAGVGTGGTVMGAGRLLKKYYRKITIHPLEPANSPTLRTGCKVGKHRIQGISDEFVPPIVHLDWLDEIVDISDSDSIRMSQKLAADLGLAVGISSGANFLGALKLAHARGANSIVATVFADDNKKYLSTDLCNEVPAQEREFADAVELLEFQVIR